MQTEVCMRRWLVGSSGLALRALAIGLAVLRNALETMPPGDTVTMEGQGRATHVQLLVRDTGSGIPAARLAQIFEPLYTTKPERTGLDLYSVQAIVTAHEGQITVESVKGQGTTFTLTLPRAGGWG